jgi:hypothetical protein
MDQQQHKEPMSKQHGNTGNSSTTPRSVQQSKQRTRLLQSQQTPEQLLEVLQQHSADLDHPRLTCIRARLRHPTRACVCHLLA